MLKETKAGRVNNLLLYEKKHLGGMIMVKSVIKMSEICRKYEPKVLDPIRLDLMTNCTKLDVQVMMLKREGYTEEQIYEIVKPTCDTLDELLTEMKTRESGET